MNDGMWDQVLADVDDTIADPMTVREAIIAVEDLIDQLRVVREALYADIGETPEE